MSDKKIKAINFIRKNLYYFIFLVCLSVVTLITVAIVVATNNNSPSLNDGNVIENPSDNPSGGKPSDTPTDNPSDNPSDAPTDNPSDNPSDTPTVTVVVFDMPVNGTIIKDYVDAGVIYNQTLGIYTGHKAIDFSAEEGTNVIACYDGTIESIVSGKLEGTTITIDHGNGLKSVYNSIEVSENLSAGDLIKRGTVIGTVSTNNRKEFKDGAHLHFEVLENGVKVNPQKYLLTEEK